MATKTVAAKPGPVGTAMLEQLADLDAESISPETARKFLDLAFSRLQQERVHALSQKAREGPLTPTDAAESTSPSEWLTFSRSCNRKHAKARQARRPFGINPWRSQQS